MEQLRKKQGFICDMDGVIYHGNRLLPGVESFLNWLKRENGWVWRWMPLIFIPAPWLQPGS